MGVHGELHSRTNDSRPARRTRDGLHSNSYEALTLKLTFRVSTLFDVLSVTLISRR